MQKAILTKRCPYCQIDSEVVGMSVREIPNYKNPITGKNTAIVERLSCAHEYIDNKFNVDSIYWSNPRPAQSLRQNIEEKIPLPTYYRPADKAGSGLNIMDILCAVCFLFLLFTVPPLAIIPTIYFILRMR